MPLNSIPPTTTVANLREKTDASKGQCHVDVGFWGGVIPGNQDDLLPLIEAGVKGFKCFLCPSGVDEFPNVEEKDLHLAMNKLKVGWSACCGLPDDTDLAGIAAGLWQSPSLPCRAG